MATKTIQKFAFEFPIFFRRGRPWMTPLCPGFGHQSTARVTGNYFRLRTKSGRPLKPGGCKPAYAFLSPSASLGKRLSQHSDIVRAGRPIALIWMV
jgi:hypothetical protein